MRSWEIKQYYGIDLLYSIMSTPQNIAEAANYTAYSLVGLGLLLTNATIILIVSRHRTLRAKKEYIILTGKSSSI